MAAMPEAKVRLASASSQIAPVLEHFEIGIVDPAVDEARFLVGALLAQAIGEFEEFLAVLGGAEDKGRGVKDGRFQRPLAEERIVAVAHHQGFRRERPIAEESLAPSLVRHRHRLPANRLMS
jgi:hypothetical protein